MLTNEQLNAAADAIDRHIEATMSDMRRAGLDRSAANQQAIAGSLLTLKAIAAAARAAAKVGAAS